MQESSKILKYGKAALLMGIALLVPCQLCWADNASLNSAASNAPHAVQPENTADVSLNSSMGLNTGSSERTGASAADPEPNTPSTGASEGAGSDSQSPDSSHPTYAKGWNETEDGWVYLTSDNQDSFCEGGSSSAIRGTGLTPPPILWRRVSLNAMAVCIDLSIRVLARVL